MSILQGILTWSKNLPDWQSDAIGRLFSKQNLTSDDIEDLYALLKSEHGIPDQKKRKAKRLAADLISVPTPPDEHIELLGIKNLVHVNAIADDQKLVFHPKGLTVVYGDNGVGKSGYSRVLKRACRARDQTEQIFPNVNLPLEIRGPAEATFEININGEIKEEKWIDGTPAHETLSTIAIFDRRCARAYVDDEDDFSYVPYGLDIFEGLADVCRQIKLKIEQEQSQHTLDVTQFSDLCGKTAVGNLIENLSEHTDLGVVETLASVKPEDIKQHDILDRSLKTGNPKEKAGLLRVRSQRIIRVTNNIIDKLTLIADTKITHLMELDRDYLVAQSAAEITANKFNNSGNLLPGTGGDAWKVLFEAAQKFSEEAYIGKPFPYIEMGAKCPLCQQILDDGALRLQQFDEYVQQEIEIKYQKLRKELNDTKNTFVAQNMVIGLDDETFSEIAFCDKVVAQEFRNFEKVLNDRFEKIIAAFSSHDWTDIPDIPTNPIDKLASITAKLNTEADILEKAAEKVSCEEIQSQYDELDARIHLSQRKPAVLFAINEMILQAKLKECLSAVRTKAISQKASEIAEMVISEKLADSLNDEFMKLSVSDLKVSFNSRTEKGRTFYKLKLNLSHSGSPSDILSEGEQRAIAIGSFLAEVGINGGSGGIIFDDPVSSLDHSRRERVAKRLAQEAEKRQVIVFTHDLYFLCILIEEGNTVGVPVISQSLVKRHHKFGLIESDLPFEGMSTSKRVNFLKTQYQEIVRLKNEGDEQKCRRLTIEVYDLLRNAWERAVEEVLLDNVVVRFRKGVETQRLKRVIVEDSDYWQVYQGMAKCSNFAHDKALMGGVAVPDPDELRSDIDKLDNWRSTVEKRKESTSKSRKTVH